MKNPSLLSRAFELVNSFWLTAMAVYFLDHCAILGSIGIPFSWSKVLDPFIALPAKVILIAWAWGLIIEAQSGEATTPYFRNFIFNVQKGWRLVLIILFGPWAAHCLAFLATGKNLFPIELLNATIGTALSYWISRQFIKIKYSRQAPALKDPPVSGLLALHALFLLILSTGMFFVDHWAQAFPLIKPLTGVLSIQISFLAFVVFSGHFLNSHPELAEQFVSPKTLILVNFSGGGTIQEIVAPLLRQYPPFFTVLRALTPKGYRFIEYNRVPFWSKRFYQSNALVAISCFTSNCADAYKVAKEFRRCGSKVVMGGPHVSFFPEEALEFCDSVVTGPAESVWDTVVRDHEAGSLQRTYQGFCSEEGLARVHQYLMDGPVETAAAFLQINRGCKFNCSFCSAKSLLNGAWVEKSLQEMLALIKKVSLKKRGVVFIDDNIYANPAYAKELFEALIPLKVHWSASASIDIAQNDETLRLLKKAGCNSLLIGYEIDAGSAEQGKGGKFALAKNYMELTRKIQRAGILIKAQFIFGFPGDSWGSLARLWWFCFRLSPFNLGLTFLTPLPGAPFFHETIKGNRIANLNWRCLDLWHQAWEHPRLGHPWIFRKGFLIITAFFFFTASSLGRIITGLLVLRSLFLLR